MIKMFYIGSTDLNMWLHQNKAQFTGDFSEGVLLDNFVVVTKRPAIACIYEHYLNDSSSDYYIEFEPITKDNAGQNALANWYGFVDRIGETEQC